MSATALSTTTLTNAITPGQTTFVVGATTGITGPTTGGAGTILVLGKEAMKVINVPVSGTVTVLRGVEGSIPRVGAAGARIWFGTPQQFQQLRDGILGTLGDPSLPLPQYPTPGNRITDGFGNEHILCDFTGTVHSGVVVFISNDGLWNADATVIGNRIVGVVSDQTSTSDQMGLVQIYGTCSAQEAGGTSAATSAYIPIVASSVSSPATGMAALIGTTSTPQQYIYGMFITGAATTAVTSAVSHTGVAVPVFLNYPYVMLAATDVGLS